MVTAAQSMAPVISRMEPLARSLKKPDQESEAAPAKPASKPAARPAERPRPARIPAPPLAQAAPPAEASPAPAPIPAPAAGSGPPLNERQKYTVLLGAFGKEENALNLKARMEAAGLPAAISEVTDKNKLWFRVMSGTFEDRSSADAYGRELRLRKLVDRPYVKPL
jgi:DedD protein